MHKGHKDKAKMGRFEMGMGKVGWRRGLGENGNNCT